MTEEIKTDENKIEGNTKVEELKIAFGYTVGLGENGKFIFKIHGKDPGLVELFGIHKYAEKQIELVSNVSQGYGIPVIMKQLNEILEKLNKEQE